jgi:drug/metabolite transporter (DMT)-like permease
MTGASSIIQRLNQVPGRVYLLTATLIFAAANSVTRRLMDIGAQNLINGKNPLSVCNVLFVGNLCALVILLTVYRQQIRLSVFRQLSTQDLLGAIAVAILSGAVAPALFFAALEATTVNNVILIGRIEPPLVLALSVVLSKATVNRWVVAGAIFSFLGVVLTVFLPSPHANAMQIMGFQIGRGELMVAAGAIAAAVSSIISQVTLKRIPLGLFNVLRTAIGTVVFSIAAIQLFGVAHFANVFSPFVWKWIILYGAVIVVGGQLCWFAGLRNSNVSELSLASAFNPIAGILMSYLVLQEVPTVTQGLGGAVILIGIILSQVGISRQSQRTPMQSMQASAVIEREMEVGFRGI